MHSDPQPAADRHSSRFDAWVNTQGLHGWPRLLAAAYPQIMLIAQTAGIDWDRLSRSLPTTGQLLKGGSLPVLSPKDRGRCAFIWHLNVDRQLNQWPTLLFMSFRHGGTHQLFHGRGWAWSQYNQDRLPVQTTPVPHQRPRSTPQRDQQEALWRAGRFARCLRSWQSAPAATPEQPILLKRLAGHAGASLLARIDLRHCPDQQGGHLLATLRHHRHGLTGFQALHGHPLDSSGRTQDLTIRQTGLKSASLICIRGQYGYEHWPVAICEGLFTGLSIALAWPGPLAVALDAYNLSAVRQNIARRCVFFADDDRWSSCNTGLQRARSARQAGDGLLTPNFAQHLKSGKPTDFNDLLCLQGLPALQQQVRAAWPSQRPQP